MEFDQLFIKSKGKPVEYKGELIYMYDKMKLSLKQQSLKITFLETNSFWIQGIILETNGEILINNKNIKNSIILWEDTAPPIINLEILSKNNLLLIYNAWKTEDGTVFFRYNGGGMKIVDNNSEKIYYCNDGFPDDDFDDLIFKIEFLG